MKTHLPTCVHGSWTVTALRDSLVTALRNDTHGQLLRMFFYAITTPGWRALRGAVRRWQKSEDGREVVVYVGTDHGITEPGALEAMQKDGVLVRMMREYQGVFHPKVVWLHGDRANVVWVGSNNLTKDGLLHNVEFALMARSGAMPEPLKKWAKVVDSGSVELTKDLLTSYETERKKDVAVRAKARTTTFSWSEKREPPRRNRRISRRGDLVVEIMPKETGDDGKQIQLPVEAADAFFRISKVGATKTVTMETEDGKDARPLTMTVFKNNTVRLSINDLEYGDRPCVIRFHRKGGGRYSYEIVSQSIFPTRFRSLLGRCDQQTRRGSRRWGVLRRGVIS